jgi:N-dimethylarginine dimethylaminohydrolase
MTSDLTWGRRYLMCPPAHFEISYAINPWMDTAVAVDGARAQRQWDALVATLRAAGAQVETLEPAPGLPDLVFTANLGLVDGRTFIPARMRHAERRAEPALAERWFAQHGYAVRRLPADVVQEGAGDALPFDGTLVGGCRTRSSASSYVELARMVDARILPVELADERFYHLDIVFCPLDSHTALYAPTALEPDSARAIAELVEDPIALTADERARYPATSVSPNGSASPAPSCVTFSDSLWTVKPCSLNQRSACAVSGRRSRWRIRADTKLAPSTMPTFAVKTRSGSPGCGSSSSTSAPASRRVCTSASHWRCARSRSTGIVTSIHGLIA